MSSPESKRQRVTRKQVEWKVVLDTPHTFKTLLGIMVPIVSHVTFHIRKDDTFTGLRMEAINNSRVCAVKIAYECQLEVDVEEEDNQCFCVDTAMFKKLLTGAHASSVVDLVKYVGDDWLTINNSDGHSCVKSQIQLVESETNLNDTDVRDIQFNHVVEMPSEELKAVCNMIHNIDASFVEFRVRQPFLQTADAVAQNYIFSIHGDGEGATTCKMYNGSVSDGNTAKATIQIDTNCGKGEELSEESMEAAASDKCRGVFPLTYISTVLKNIDRLNVQLFFSTGLPMVMQYGLGGELSYIKIIIAPREGGD